MFVLHLIFVLHGAAPSGSTFEDRYLEFPTHAACAAAMEWWIDNPQAQLQGMDEEARLLMLPVPAWNCQSSAPAIG